MDIEEAVFNRRAMYPAQFSGEKVDEETIRKMLELANWAPTHKHTEPWRFKVYEGKALDKLIDEVCDLYIRTTPTDNYNAGFVEKMEGRKEAISHIVIIIMERHLEYGLPEFEEIAATAMAVQNMWLYTAKVTDVGAYWSSPSIVLGEAFHQQLGLKDNQKCLGMFLIGKLKKEAIKAEGKRGDWKEKVEWYKN